MDKNSSSATTPIRTGYGTGTYGQGIYGRPNLPYGAGTYGTGSYGTKASTK